jgi:archaellum biogenesis ATPase FlaH
MLENLILEIINSLKSQNRDIDKYIVIDSLSALMIYNDSEIIREFISHVMNRSRTENIHVVSILVEEEMDSNKLIQLNDKIIVLRDSFID